MSDKALRRVLALIEAFRELDPEMPAQTIATFITIGLSPGITPKEIEDQLGISRSASSRNVSILSNRTREGEKTHGLVEYRQDPKDFRRKELHPTKLGLKLLATVLAVMKD